jgi:hypothetical protein
MRKKMPELLAMANACPWRGMRDWKQGCAKKKPCKFCAAKK